MPRVQAVEKLALRSALGRVLPRDVVSPIDVPAHDNSAMDGYALRGAELGAERRRRLRGGRRRLRRRPRRRRTSAPAQCVRIMTGAVMPAGLDTVVPQEFVTRRGRRACAFRPASCGPATTAACAGEDLARGAVALAAGRISARPTSACSRRWAWPKSPVYRRLRVAFFSTGNELRSIGETLDARLRSTTATATPSGACCSASASRSSTSASCATIRPRSKRRLRSAARDADAMITSGGVSVGEADHTKLVMARLGDVLFWRIAMRPGPADGDRPHRRAAASAAILFGLPGNPVAVMVTFYALVRDACWR